MRTVGGVSLRLFVLSALIAVASGLAAGWLGYAFYDRSALPDPVRRTSAVRALLDAHERGRWDETLTRADAARLGEEALLLWAMANDDRETLQTLEREARDVSVRARALVFEPQRELTSGEFLTRLHERHPRSWILERVPRIEADDR